MPDGTYEKGLAAEDRAETFLKNRGMVPLARRYRSPFGEIDLVMRDGDTLVFVEVKARNTGRNGAGLAAVNARKRAKIIRTALNYLAAYPTDCACRFDALEWTRDGWQHIVNAFEGSEFS
jgi:putative endonuclease